MRGDEGFALVAPLAGSPGAGKDAHGAEPRTPKSAGALGPSPRRAVPWPRPRFPERHQRCVIGPQGVWRRGSRGTWLSGARNVNLIKKRVSGPGRVLKSRLLSQATTP